MPLDSMDDFHWETLTEAVNRLYTAPKFLRDMVFKEGRVNSSENISFDVTIGGRQVLPVVSNVSAGTVIDKLGREKVYVKAPRVRPKKSFDAFELLAETPAGRHVFANGGDISSARRQRIGEELLDQKESIERTKEAWCAEALKGILSIEQEDIAFSVDYRVPTEHKITPAVLWDSESEDILKDLETMADLIIDKNFTPSFAIMGKDAWSAIQGSTKTMNALDKRRLDPGALKLDVNSLYKGNLNGIDLYRYNAIYTPWGSSTTQKLIPDNAFILFANDGDFKIEYAPVMDLEAGNVLTKYFSKSWIEKDPSVLWMIAESRPLPLIKTPEAFVYATVTA